MIIQILIRIKNDTNLLKNEKCIIYVTYYAGYTVHQKNTFEKTLKGILRYYLRFCFPAFLPTGLFWRFAKVSCCVAFCAGLLGVLRSGKTTLS